VNPADVTLWNWENPQPFGNDLSAMWGSSDTDVWAAGDSVMHWDGRQWSVVPTNAPLANTYSLVGTAPNDIYIYGGDAQGSPLALHYDGTRWSQMPPPGADESQLVAINGQVYACGQEAERWDGARWSQLPLGNDLVVRELWGTGPNDLWVAGDDGLFGHFDGRVLSRQKMPTGDQPYGLVGRSSDDVFLFTDAGTAHYDGRRWRPVRVPGLDSEDATIMSPTVGPNGDVYAIVFVNAYDQRVVRWDGGSFSTVTHLAGDQPASALWVAPSGTLFVVGTGMSGMFSGGSWVTSQTFVEDGLTAVDAVSPNDVWAGGNQGAIAHRDAHGWSLIQGDPDAYITRVWAVAPGQAYALGEDALYRIAGETITPISIPIDPDEQEAYDLWAAGPRDVWITASGGQILHYDGARFSTELIPGMRDDARAIWGSSDRDVWVTSDSGLYHFDGGSWSHVRQPSVDLDGAQLTALAGSGPNDVWAVGTSNVFHFDGSRWQDVSPPPTPAATDEGGESFTAVASANARDAWVVGSVGLYHWNGSGWQSGPNGGLFGISASPSGDVFGVGLNGRILHAQY
jgi:hypothetical protein